MSKYWFLFHLLIISVIVSTDYIRALIVGFLNDGSQSAYFFIIPDTVSSTGQALSGNPEESVDRLDSRLRGNDRGLNILFAASYINI